MTRDQVLTLLIGAMQRLPSHRPLRVGIDGRSGAGKTRLGDELADRLEARGRTCHRASLDDFHPPGYRQRIADGTFTPAAYLEQGYDTAAIRRLLLEPAGPGGNRRCRLDLWNAHDDVPFPEDWVELADDAVLLVDGVFLLTPSLRELWDFTIWLDVDWQIMLRRAAHRDGVRLGSEELVREGYRTGWIPRHILYEETIHPHDLVDVVVDNSDIEHPYIVRLRPSTRPSPTSSSRPRAMPSTAPSAMPSTDPHAAPLKPPR